MEKKVLSTSNDLYLLILIIFYFLTNVSLSSVQSLSHVQLFVTLWTAAHQAPLYITNSQSLLKLIYIESVMLSNHLTPCCPLLLPQSFSASGSFPMS